MTHIIRSGIDLIDIERVEKSISRFGDRFLNRIFTQQELADCEGNIASLAARFSAKEAAAKALGCGIGVVSWQEIEVIRNSSNQPELVLHGEAQKLAKKLKLTTWSVSLSHTNQNSIACVVAIGENE